MPDALAEENTVIATISVGDSPRGIAFDSANNRMYVANYLDDTVSVIDTEENTVIATIDVGDHPSTLDSVNNRMYVTNAFDNTISVIDTDDNTVIATIAAGTNPVGIAFDSANNRMYVANYNQSIVSVIDTDDNTVIATISVGSFPFNIAFDSANDRMYVTEWKGHEVSVINTATNTVDATIAAGDYPVGIAFDSANNRMYVGINSDDTVKVINTATNEVDATISVGDYPYGIAFDSVNNRMYVTNRSDGTFSVINTATNEVDATISIGRWPHGIAFDSANNRMYITNQGDNTVSVIDIAPNAVDATSSSDCYDCEPPKLQSTQIQISSNISIIVSDDESTNITANVGDEIEIILEITDNKSVHLLPTSGIYTNFMERPNNMNLFFANNFDNLKQTSTSFYEWNRNYDDVAYDYADTVTWSSPAISYVESSTTDEHFIISFKMKFTDSMKPSQIWVSAADYYGQTFKVPLPLTLEIIPKEIVVLSDAEEIATLDKGDVLITPSEDTTPLLNEPVLFTVLSQWSGYSQVISDDAEMLSVIGLQGESLPAWTKNLGEWVIQEKLDVSELITAIQYVINQ